MNELIVTNTWYAHKDIHKFSWVCPGRQLKSLIDYFLVRKDAKARVHDVKVVRGAEIGSDHHLVLMKLNKKIKEEAKGRVVSGPKIRIERLKDRHEQLRYQWRIKQKMNWLGTNKGYHGQVEGESVEKTWAEFKECILSAAVEVCGMRRRKNQQKRTSW